MSGRVFLCLGATLVGLLFSGAGCSANKQQNQDCEPTAYDEIGPFYRPGAPLRNKVGEGYLLQGVVRATTGCVPLPHARLEFWLVNPVGEYDADHRATVYTDKKGRYFFESNSPTDYVGRVPHIHIMASQEGYETLITQHYPQEGQIKADFDIVLPPEGRQ